MNQLETVDDAPGHWADASSEPLIMNGFPSGPHAVLLKSFLPPNLRNLEVQSLRGEIEVELLKPLICPFFESVTKTPIPQFAARGGPRPATTLMENVILGPLDYRSSAVRAASRGPWWSLDFASQLISICDWPRRARSSCSITAPLRGT